MPLYEDETTTREQLFELRRRNRCQVCRGALDVFLDVDKGKAFLACQDWRRTQHEGIEREAQPPFEPNIATRRKDMDSEYGKGKADALAKYVGQTSLQKVELQDIIETLWPEAPAVEKTKAIMLCATYGLNPLNKHIFLIPFNKGEPDETWALVMSIHCKRLLASRRGPFSYVDNTPRVMTDDEQQKVFGEVLNDRLYAITKLRDPKTSAESVGYGFWLHKDKPKGESKGNTRFNMAAIRSESQALDRLRPGEMPLGVEAVEESAIEGDFTLLAEGGGKMGEPAVSSAGSRTIPQQAAGAETIEQQGAGKAGETILPPTKIPKSKTAAPPAEPEEGFGIDLEWLKESLKDLKWSEDTTKTFLVSKYKVSPQGTLADVIKRLTREQAEEFVKAIQQKLEQKQRELF